ncbi:hypothetical protein [Arthrobacter pigmenti]|uniref:hypothetical protein n=1 Tax=Arthrobacter pigmenti TaxID=271432 RepID=UPI001FD7C5AE|nr:hypothetical protein [Arthrobacter pigmenti]
MSGSTFGASLTTLDTVDRETPASAATISRVGAGLERLASVVTIISVHGLEQVAPV